MTGHCHHCGRALKESDFGRNEICPGCRRDTRCCCNCEHHDAAYHNQCRETRAELVAEREKSNFCDHFQPRCGPWRPRKKDAGTKASFDALFKKPPLP